MELFAALCRTRRCTQSLIGAGSVSAVPTWPPKQRLADLENTLALVKLDPLENATLAGSAARYSTADGTAY